MSTATTTFDQCLRISAAHARIQHGLDDELGTYHGLGYADFRLLCALDAADDKTVAMAELVPCLGVALSSVLRQILPLEKSGLVQRESPAGGAALRRVRLSPAARQVLVNATETARAVCERLGPIDGFGA